MEDLTFQKMKEEFSVSSYKFYENPRGIKAGKFRSQKSHYASSLCFAGAGTAGPKFIVHIFGKYICAICMYALHFLYNPL